MIHYFYNNWYTKKYWIKSLDPTFNALKNLFGHLNLNFIGKILLQINKILQLDSFISIWNMEMIFLEAIQRLLFNQKQSFYWDLNSLNLLYSQETLMPYSDFSMLWVIKCSTILVLLRLHNFHYEIFWLDATFLITYQYWISQIHYLYLLKML